VSFALGSKSLAKSFQGPSASVSSRSLPEEIEEVFWFDISQENAKLHHQTLAVGSNTLELEKNGIHLVGFTGRTPASDKIVKGSKNIAGSIQMVGNLQIVSVGLDSLPISQEAQDQIDLGSLDDATSGSLASSMDAQSASANLGYTSGTLNSFGVFDGSLTKFLNPDVNQNGIFDSDPQDDLVWRITSDRRHEFKKNEILEDGRILVPIADLIDREGFQLIFWLNKNFPHLPTPKVSLILPPENVYIQKYPEQVAIQEINPYNEHPLASDGYAQYHFELGSRILSPKPPFNGDYQLRIGSDYYSFKGVNFLQPTVDTYEGFIMPSTVVEVDDNGLLTKISWYWKAIDNGIWRDATSEEVQLKARQFYYYFGDQTYRPDQLGGKTWYENGSVDVSRFNMTLESQDGKLDCVYWNRAEDDYAFSFLL
jgi:hypothetical protein